MLSYRHAFHAGNHADVLKHLTLMLVARYLTQKPAPFWYIDTHAGAGLYDLEGDQARKLGEFQEGVGRLWSRDDLPGPLADYVALVRQSNPSSKLRRYPGSPWLAQQLLRDDDRLRLFERHSTDSRLLLDLFKQAGRRVGVIAGDGFAGLKAILPPPPRRALVLIDPSYETRDDYLAVANALEESLKRFATGTYAIWYPCLARPESRRLPEKLRTIAGKNWLDVRLNVTKPASDGFGMFGSGMFVVNPPWTLAATLQDTLPWLAATLSQGEGAGFSLDQQTD